MDDFLKVARDPPQGYALRNALAEYSSLEDEEMLNHQLNQAAPRLFIPGPDDVVRCGPDNSAGWLAPLGATI